MNTAKRAKSVVIDEITGIERPDLATVTLEIEGLRQLPSAIEGRNLFELSGVQHRHAEWPKAMEALGFRPGELDDDEFEELARKLSTIIVKFDVRRMLEERIKPLL